MRMVLVDEESGPVAQVDFWIHEVRWESGTPITGVVTFRGEAPFLHILMNCRIQPLLINADTPMGLESYRVKRTMMNYRQGDWAASVELEQV